MGQGRRGAGHPPTRGAQRAALDACRAKAGFAGGDDQRSYLAGMVDEGPAADDRHRPRQPHDLQQADFEEADHHGQAHEAHHVRRVAPDGEHLRLWLRGQDHHGQQRRRRLRAEGRRRPPAAEERAEHGPVRPRQDRPQQPPHRPRVEHGHRRDVVDAVQHQRPLQADGAVVPGSIRRHSELHMVRRGLPGHRLLLGLRRHHQQPANRDVGGGVERQVPLEQPRLPLLQPAGEGRQDRQRRG
mmetsp:Transcript_64983/g.188412  ORF Transcript_64983/g.188412 Transcript_64983/m.188412 type:complete len:242 (-) Transcript_64983:3204-3929(-)